MILPYCPYSKTPSTFTPFEMSMSVLVIPNLTAPSFLMEVITRSYSSVNGPRWYSTGMKLYPFVPPSVWKW